MGADVAAGKVCGGQYGGSAKFVQQSTPELLFLRRQLLQIQVPALPAAAGRLPLLLYDDKGTPGDLHPYIRRTEAKLTLGL